MDLNSSINSLISSTNESLDLGLDDSTVEEQRTTDKENHNRLFSYNYIIKVPRENIQSEPVCREAFISIFGISDQRLRTVKRSLSLEGCPPTDKRGKHPNHATHSEELKMKVKDHISSYKGCLSHYTLTATNIIYLSKDLNVNLMHKNFLTKHPGVKFSYESYRTIFNTEFNLRFGNPRKDTCSFCDENKINIESLMNKILSKSIPVEESNTLKEDLSKLRIEHKAHLTRAGFFYSR